MDLPAVIRRFGFSKMWIFYFRSSTSPDSRLFANPNIQKNRMFASPKFWLLGYQELQYFEKPAILKFEFPKINIFELSEIRTLGNQDSQKSCSSDLWESTCSDSLISGNLDSWYSGKPITRKFIFRELRKSGQSNIYMLAISGLGIITEIWDYVN